MIDAELLLPSAGPHPLPVATAVAAVLGYARGRRPLHFRAPNARTGRWVEIGAFGFERFDARPRSSGPLGEADILTAEGLHGRLDPAAWAAMKAVLDDVAPLADAAQDRAAGRPFPDLPDDEFSVLAEPGTVGATLRRIEQLCLETPGVPALHVPAALHHRRPSLFPLLSRTTRWQLLPHVHEGDSGAAAVVHRELRANRAAFGLLQERTAGLLGVDPPLTFLRLHDMLLWLSAGQRLTHAVALGRATAEWRASEDARRGPGRPDPAAGLPPRARAANLRGVSDPFHLQRFVDAQDDGGTYDQAVRELHAGRKHSHWMWFVIPQIEGLGSSPMAQHYAISGLEEARAYVGHPVLGRRLVECARVLTALEGTDAVQVFGPVDAQKLQSSMTLFAAAAPDEPVFREVLDQYFGGEPDPGTTSRL